MGGEQHSLGEYWYLAGKKEVGLRTKEQWCWAVDGTTECSHWRNNWDGLQVFLVGEVWEEDQRLEPEVSQLQCPTAHWSQLAQV